jgi:hypothetical protein
MRPGVGDADDRYRPLSDSDGGHSASGATPAAAPELITDGPETLPGAAELIRAGFEPLESMTGASWVAEAWPDEDRASLPESRLDRIFEPRDETVWFVRSPWPGISVDDALTIIWAALPRTEERWCEIAQEVLAWPEDRARSALREIPG